MLRVALDAVTQRKLIVILAEDAPARFLNSSDGTLRGACRRNVDGGLQVLGTLQKTMSGLH